MTNSGGLILVCRWASFNDLVQNKFRSIIHLLSHYLLDQSHWRKYEINVQDLLKAEQGHWRHFGIFTYNSKHISRYPLVLYFSHFTLCTSAFTVSIVDFEQLKFRLGSYSYHSRKPWYSFLVVRKKHLIYGSHRRTQNLFHI